MRYMVAVAAAGAGLAYVVQSPQKIDVTVNRVFEGEGIRIEGLGGCAIDAKDVSCWDMQGEPALELTDRIRSHYISNTSEVQLRFGRPNRLLVLRRSPASASVGYQTEEGQYLSSSQIYGSNGEPTLEWVRYVPEDGRKTFGIVVQLHSLPKPKQAEVKFRRGEVGRIEDVRIEVGAYREEKPGNVATRGGMYPMMPNWGGRQWSVVIGALSDSGDTPNLGYQILDTSGRPIRFVDKKGVPVSDVKYLEETRGQPMYAPNPDAKFSQAVFSSGGPTVQGAFTAYTNVDPRRIGALRVFLQRQMRVKIEGFPLVPRAGATPSGAAPAQGPG